MTSLRYSICFWWNTHFSGRRNNLCSVQVYYDDPFCYDGSEDIVHHSLEGSRAVGHSEKHYEGFEEATVGVEGRLPFVSGLDVYIIETPADIQFCEIPGSAELGDEFGDEGERVSVLDGYGV